MAKAVLCPVCSGSGNYYLPPPQDSALIVGTFRTCHGCGGKGWVEVGDKESIEPAVGIAMLYGTPY